MSDTRELRRAFCTRLYEYFHDFNTVEGTLLFSSVLVCLGGIMFTNERYSVKNTKANPDFATEHEVFGYVITMTMTCHSLQTVCYKSL